MNVAISAEERRSGRLSGENQQLGCLLLHTRGYVILRNAIPESLISELRSSYGETYDRYLAEHDEGSGITWFDEAPGAGHGAVWERAGRFRIFPRVQGPFADRYVLRNPFVDPLIGAMLGKDYYCKFLSSDTCVRGSTLQAPHRDIDFYDRDKPFGYLVNTPLVPSGMHNGPIEVWPGGSHLWRSEQFARFNLQPFVQDGENPEIEHLAGYLPSKKITLLPGEVLIRDPGMWHRGTPNPTDEPRIMLTSGYFRREYYYQYGDVAYNLDVDTYRAMPSDIARLFAPHFSKTGLHYWRTRRDRAIREVEGKRFAGAPLRRAKRLARRAKRVMHDRQAAPVG